MSVSITTELRHEIQVSDESVRVLARRFHISPATVQKWRKRADTTEMPRGPKPGHCTAVPQYVADAIVLFRQQTLLPLDDCLHALRSGTPQLSRTTLHRYFRKHGLSSLAVIDAVRSDRDPGCRRLGHVHIGSMKVRIESGDAVLLNGFDRISKFAFGVIEEQASPAVLGAFIHALADAVPFEIHTVQTNSDSVFITSEASSLACSQRGITHRVVSTVSTDHAATVCSVPNAADSPDYDFETLPEVRSVLARRIDDYNYRCKLKSLGGLTPVELVAHYGAQKTPVY